MKKEFAMAVLVLPLAFPAADLPPCRSRRKARAIRSRPSRGV